MEVLVAAALISLCVGSIATMSARSIHTLRSARQAAASSLILQQRVETVRDRSWAELCSAPAMAALLSTASESEDELGDPGMVETMKVSVPETSPSGPVEGARFFAVRRERGKAHIDRDDDLSGEPTLFFEGTVTWHDYSGVHVRTLRTVVCRIGLTRSGIVGSVVGRPGTTRSAP